MLYPSVIFTCGSNLTMHTAPRMQVKLAQTAQSVSPLQHGWERLKHSHPVLRQRVLKGREESRSIGFERC